MTNYSRTGVNNPWSQRKRIAYNYDAFDRKVGKTVDNPPLGSIDSREAYVYDGQHEMMQFVGTGSNDLTASDLAHRYLYGPAVDQILASDDADVTRGDATRVSWLLADNEGTIRDVSSYRPDGLVEGIVDHLQYDAFGNLTGQSNSLEQPRFTYTAREFDSDTGLYYYRARWYDAKTGKFISQDPIGFEGGDENLYRYCGNGPTNATDPSGCIKRTMKESMQPGVGGNFQVQWTFELDKTYDYDVTVIQRVFIDFQNWKPPKWSGVNVLKIPSITYFEVVGHVPANQTKVIVGERDESVDTWSFGAKPFYRNLFCSGRIVMKGMLRAFKTDDVKDAIANWQPNRTFINSPSENIYPVDWTAGSYPANETFTVGGQKRMDSFTDLAIETETDLIKGKKEQVYTQVTATWSRDPTQATHLDVKTISNKKGGPGVPPPIK